MNFTQLIPNIFYTDIQVGLRFFIECLEFPEFRLVTNDIEEVYKKSDVNSSGILTSKP